MSTVEIQPGQTTEPGAEYDPKLPLPYPWHIEADGSVARQDFWRGDPARLAGFQNDRAVQHVDLRTEDWLAGDVQAAVGKWPVFIREDGSMWNDTRPIASVSDYRPTNEASA